MLKIKSVRTVGFVGDGEMIVRELTSPLKRSGKSDCFYYKSSLYRVENVDDAAVRVVVFSAVDLFCNISDLLDLCDCQKTVVYIKDCKRAKRSGFKIDKARLSYMLSCPVVFDRGTSVRGLNRLLSLIHIVSDTPSYYTALENPSLARRSAVMLKCGIFTRFRLLLSKFIFTDL